MSRLAHTWLAAILVGALVFPACGGLDDPAGDAADLDDAEYLDGKADSASTKPKTITVTETKNGKTITARVGDTVDVRLGGNPTTGYEWQAVLYSKSLPIADSQYIPDTPVTIGSGGTYSFVFQPNALAAGGKHTAKFAYYRSWEGPEAAIRTFSITIKVPKVSLAKEGQPCSSFGNPVAPACEPGLVCEAGPAPDSATCVKPECATDADCPELVAPGGNGFMHEVCVAGKCVLPAPGPIAVDESMNGKTVAASVGDLVRVSLEGNPTTGYAWKLVSYSKGLPVTKSDYVPDQPITIGSGGTYTFELQVTPLAAGGTHTATFAYYRAWEGVQAAVKTFSISIAVP
jgi:inhibitor of cysteine peptidase